MWSRNFRRALLGSLLVMLTSCGAPLDEPQLGVYRAVLELPGGESPFVLTIAREQTRYVLYLSSGGERTRVNDVRVAQDELTAVLPGGASMRAKMYRKRLEGDITLREVGGKRPTIPLRATLGATYRFYAEPSTDNADVSGRWELTLTDDGGNVSKASAQLAQEHDSVSGTVTMGSGESVALQGQVHGDDVQLATFTGEHAYLYKLRVDTSGDLDGDYWQDLAVHAKIAARRTE